MSDRKVPIKRSKGSYQKTIVSDIHSESRVTKTDHGGYYFFEIEAGKKAIFHLDVLHASNREDTALNVYWVAQDHKDFQTRKWLEWRNTVNKLELHELLMALNKGSKYGEEYLEDGSPNPDYAVYTKENTKYVGRRYFATNPFVDKYRDGQIDDNVKYGNFSYRTNRLGSGIWLEGINYWPEWKSQGAFIIAVAEPQITSLYVEKRTSSERKVREKGIIEQDNDHVYDTLIYGDYINLHVCLHNVFNYAAHIEIYCGEESMDIATEGGDPYYRIIELDKHRDFDNPALNYNLKFLEEELIDLRWAERSGHEEGKRGGDSLKDFRMKFVLTPEKEEDSCSHYGYERKTLTREFSLTVNYKDNFSLDIHEPEYVEQIAYINQAPMVSQSFERCLYKSIEISGKGFDKSLVLLQENSDGSLKDNKTPYLEFVAGNSDHRPEITIEVSGADVTECEANLLSPDEEKQVTHEGNTISTESIVPIPYKKAEGIWEIIKNQTIFPEVQPYQELKKTDEILKFKLAYPYNAFNELTFALKFALIHFQPAIIPITIASCRYVRTPQFFVFPDVVWAAHANYDPKKILYFQDKQVELVEGYGDWMSLVALGVEELHKPLEKFIGTVEGGGELNKIIKDFVEGSKTPVALGVHASYDNDKIINYAEISPYKQLLYGYIIGLVILSIAVDLLMVYLTRGKVAPGLQKAKKAVKSFNQFKDKYNLSFEMPKLSVNYGFYREQYDFGRVATVFEGTLQADPLLAVSSSYKFDPKELPEGLKKFAIKAKVKGSISMDINFKYNSHTGEFTCNNNAKDQKGGGGTLLRDGDVFRFQGTLSFDVKVSGKYEKEFKLWDFLPIKTTLEGKGSLSSSFGVIKKIGYDRTRGIFFEDILFFDGLKGNYMQNVEVRSGSDMLIDTNEDNEIKTLNILKSRSISLGRKHIFNIFRGNQ